jgi:diacylglycerol kinase
MDWSKLANSFRYAGRGLMELWKHQQNFRIELFAAVLIIFATYIFHIRSIERGLIVLMVLLVLAAEIMNSVFETILDGISKQHNEHFRMAKDAMAAMTLIMAMGAVMVGLIIFYPYVRFLVVG